MVHRQHKPAALVSPTSAGPQPIVNVGEDVVSATLPTGESVCVHLYGATVTSWKSNGGLKENLWLSTSAKLDGSKAIRGGIPIVFPVFGPPPKDHPTSSLPQHGFARVSQWEYLGKSNAESSLVSSSTASTKTGSTSTATTSEARQDHDDEDSSAVRLDFGLTPANLQPEHAKAWPYSFALQYSVTLGREGLRTMLEVRNEGTEKFDFQFLEHTYFKVDDVSRTSVTGLAGVRYTDKLQNNTECSSQGHELKIESGVDRMYKSLTQDTTSILIDGNKPVMDIVRDNLDDVVIWNPWKEGAAAMSDWEPKEGYKQMLCVEAGSVGGWQVLEGSDIWEGGQVLRNYSS